MPIPKPRGGEGENNFISRCIGFLINEGRPSNEAAAICYDQWRGKESTKMSEIKEIYDEVQEGNPTRAQGNITVGQGRGYEQPEGAIAGQYNELEVDEDQQTPRSDAQDLDDLFPVK